MNWKSADLEWLTAIDHSQIQSMPVNLLKNYYPIISRWNQYNQYCAVQTVKLDYIKAQVCYRI